MPYLRQDFRDVIESQINLKWLANYFASLKFDEFVGALNYLVYTIVKQYLDRNGTSYAKLAGIVGTLKCCISEIYRRIAGPYEDLKIHCNGDV